MGISDEKSVDPQKTVLQSYGGEREHYERFNKEMEEYFATHGDIYGEVYKDEVFDLTDVNCRDRAAAVLKDLVTRQGPKVAEQWKKFPGWTTVVGQQTFRGNVEQFVLATYQRICQKAAKDVVERAKASTVGSLFEEFGIQFAGVEPEVIEEKIKELEKGLTRDKQALQPNHNALEWLTGLEVQRQNNKGLLRKAEAELEPRLKDSNLCRSTTSCTWRESYRRKQSKVH